MDSHQANAALPTRPALPPAEDSRPWYRLTKPMAVSSPAISVRKPDGAELVLGDFMAEEDWLICWEGRPEHYMEPVNEAAADMVSKFPELDLYTDPLEQLQVVMADARAAEDVSAMPTIPAVERAQPAPPRRKRRSKRRGAKRKARATAGMPAATDSGSEQ